MGAPIHAYHKPIHSFVLSGLYNAYVSFIIGLQTYMPVFQSLMDGFSYILLKAKQKGFSPKIH